MLAALFAAVGAPVGAFKSGMLCKAKIALADDTFARLPPTAQGQLLALFSEISPLANDHGEACLRDAAGLERGALVEQFAAMHSSCDRAAWARLEHPVAFERASAIWFFDRRSVSGRFADAFEAPAEVNVAADLTPLEAEIRAIIAKDVGGDARVKIERHDLDGAVLLAISHEELWTTATEFADDGELRARALRTVHHAAAKIESGMLTIAAERGGAARRAALCKTIAEFGLGIAANLSRLPPLTYDLQRLLDWAPFVTDPAHLISDVLVTSLAVSAPGLDDALLELSTSGRAPTDVRERMLKRLSPSERPFASVKAGELRVIFSPRPGQSKSRAVRLVFSGPTTCKVQLDCAEEALVRSRYLKAWGLIAPQRGAQPPAR